MVLSEERKFVPKRSKRIQRKYISEYASGDLSEDKDACWSSSNDGKMLWLPRDHQYTCNLHTILSLFYAECERLAIRRRSKRKLGTRLSTNDDDDDNDFVNCKWMLFELKFFHFSDKGCGLIRDVCFSYYGVPCSLSSPYTLLLWEFA